MAAASQESGAAEKSGYAVTMTPGERRLQGNTPHMGGDIEFHPVVQGLPLSHGTTHVSPTMILLTQKS